MRILIDIGHPAHVHLFKHFAWEMQKKEHTIFFTCREKEYEIDLLTKYGFVFNSFGKKYNSRLGKLWGLAEFDLKEFIRGIKFKPDIFLSHGSIYASHAAFLLRKPHISLEDSGNWEQIKLYLPFTKTVLSPSVLPEDLGFKQIRYNSYHELAYLHPKYFTPNQLINEDLHLNQDDNFALLRFVSWKATHDLGHKGLSSREKNEIIDYLLDANIKPIISSESILPDEYLKYRYSISSEKMHDVLSKAIIFIGEGATMASEAGVLGTPSVYINSISRSYCDDQEKYGTIYNYRRGKDVIKKVKEIIAMPNLKTEWQNRRLKILNDKIDLTSLLVWFVENYPESFKIMKENPDYQNNFK